MEFNDHIYWWIGCFMTYCSVLFSAYLLFNLLVDFLYKRMKYHARFIEFLQWQRKQKLEKKFPQLKLKKEE